MTELDKAEKLAKIAYRAYGETTNFKNFRDEPMPDWDELPSTIKEAWAKASRAVESTTNGFPPLGSELSCRCYWTVEAGVVPGIPQPELTRNFGMTSGEYELGNRWEIFTKKMVESIEYARRLHNPEKLNWVTLKWVWC